MADPKQYNYKQIDVPYTDKNNGSIVINAEEINHDTPLDLLGNSVVNWGEKYNKNILHLLENFASSVEPANPTEGMIWFNNKSKELNIYTSNNGWTKSSRLFVDNDEINQPLVGDIKITNDDIYIYNTNKIFVRLLTSKDETIVVYTQNDYNMKIQDDIVICSNNKQLINVILNTTVTKKVSILSSENFGINIPNDIIIYGNKINDFVIPPKSEAIILCNAINNTFVLISIHKIDSISDSVQSFKGNQTNARLRNGEINVEIGDYDTDLITDGRLTIGYEDICPPISKRFTTNTLVVGPNKVTINRIATDDVGMISDNIIPTTGWIGRFVNGQSYGFITKEMLNDGTLLADFSEAKVKGFDVLTSNSMNGYVKEIDLTNNTFKLEVKSLLVDGSNVVNESVLNDYANITSLGNNVYNGSFKSLKINNKEVAILDSPQFTGNPKSVTVNYLTNDDTIATTKFVHDITDNLSIYPNLSSVSVGSKETDTRLNYDGTGGMYILNSKVVTDYSLNSGFLDANLASCKVNGQYVLTDAYLQNYVSKSELNSASLIANFDELYVQDKKVVTETDGASFTNSVSIKVTGGQQNLKLINEVNNGFLFYPTSSTTNNLGTLRYTSGNGDIDLRFDGSSGNITYKGYELATKADIPTFIPAAFSANIDSTIMVGYGQQIPSSLDMLINAMIMVYPGSKDVYFGSIINYFNASKGPMSWTFTNNDTTVPSTIPTTGNFTGLAMTLTKNPTLFMRLPVVSAGSQGVGHIFVGITRYAITNDNNIPQCMYRITNDDIVESFYCSVPLIDKTTNNEWIDCDVEFHNNITEIYRRAKLPKMIKGKLEIHEHKKEED